VLEDPGIRVTFLHATMAGKSLYENTGDALPSAVLSSRKILSLRWRAVAHRLIIPTGLENFREL